jgi:hypothetical protein
MPHALVLRAGGFLREVWHLLEKGKFDVKKKNASCPQLPTGSLLQSVASVSWETRSRWEAVQPRSMLRRTALFLLLAVPAALAWTTPTPQPRMPVAARGPPPSSLLPTELQKPTSSLLPFGVLMMVPVAWGTYGVSIKSCYALTSPPPELAFGLLQYVISSSVLSFALFAAQPQEPPAPSSQKPTANAAAAGLELGGYLFVAALLQIFGLGMTTATRGAFIVQAPPRSRRPPRSGRPPRAVTLPPTRSPSHSRLWPPRRQLTTIIVPLMDAAIKRTAPSKLTLGACGLAFGGVTALVQAEPALATGSTLMGDSLIGVAALIYSPRS